MSYTEQPQPIPSGPTPPVLHTRGLSKSIGRTAILHDIDLVVERGDFLGLIGPNGSGKTTLIKCITGQLVVDPGCVGICGYDIARDVLEAKRRFGYALEPEFLPVQLTGDQLIALVASAKELTAFHGQVRHLAGLFDLTDRLSDEIGTYSAGMKQKLSLIASLLGQPALVILDESLNGLDPVGAYRFKNHLREMAEAGQTAVLLASHAIETVEKYCSRVAIMQQGAIRSIYTKAELDVRRAETGMDLEEMFMQIVDSQPQATEAISKGKK